MKFFVDSANVQDIKEIISLGIVAGVTTNPTLIAREGRDLTATLTEIGELLGENGVFFGEVNSLEHQAMIAEARELVKISPLLSVKIPMCAEGLKAISVLSQEDISTNCTLIFTAGQALLAARAGANFVSPFMGRLDDIGSDGIQLIADCAEIFSLHDLDCEIIAASIRSPLHVIESARVGAHIATIPPKVIYQLIDHPMTTKGIAAFVKDWEDLQAKL